MTLRDLLAAAIPGPWRVSLTDDTVVIGPDRAEVAAIDGDYNEPDLWPIMEANARLIALAPQLAEALIEAQEAMKPFSEMAGEMFAANWNDEGVAISFVTKNGPLRLTFRQFRAIHAAATRIDAILGERDD